MHQDLSLSASSTCIDTGDDAAAPPWDRNGVPWADVPNEDDGTTAADRGAFEYVP